MIEGNSSSKLELENYFPAVQAEPIKVQSDGEPLSHEDRLLEAVLYEYCSIDDPQDLVAYAAGILNDYPQYKDQLLRLFEMLDATRVEELPTLQERVLNREANRYFSYLNDMDIDERFGERYKENSLRKTPQLVPQLAGIFNKLDQWAQVIDTDLDASDVLLRPLDKIANSERITNSHLHLVK